MLMPVSSEFVALCRAQILLLTQAFGASISVVYLTGELGGNSQAQLVPIAAYPDLRETPHPVNWPSLLPEMTRQETKPTRLIESEAIAPELATTTGSESEANPAAGPAPRLETSELVDQRRFVLPLMHDEVVLGLLVTRRADRAWNEWEQAQIQEIANTLAIACVMDQRYQWLGHERKQTQLLQAQHHDLMDNLLHQFRNSLTALQTFGKLILKRLVPGDRGHELAASISQETSRLRDLAQQMEAALAENPFNPAPLALPFAFDDVPESPPDRLYEQLGAATLEAPGAKAVLPIGLLAGKELALERCLVDVILAPLLTAFRELAQAQELTLKLAIAEDLPPVWANPQALREVVNNLLENAIKYTQPPGEIEVWVQEDLERSQLVAAVSDTGVGIPPADLPHIFERHYRGVQAQGKIAGSGLGLAIARSLVEQMGGEIEVFSPALTLPSLSEANVPQPEALLAPSQPNQPHRGTTFVVRLPLALAQSESEA